MRTFKARGIVIREYEAGESDKRLVLLCKDIGRLTVYARGARKPKSKLMAAAQLFAYGDYVLADGRQFNSVNQAEIIESFYQIRADYTRLCHAHLMLEVCEKSVMDNNPCDDLLLLLLKSLTHLSRPGKESSAGVFILPPEQISCVFLFRFYLYYGIAPAAEECCVCGEDAAITEEGAAFCDEGYACRKCAPHKKRRLRISQAAWAGIKYITGVGLAEAFMFDARAQVLEELKKAARFYWDCHFDWKLNSGEFV